MKRTLRMNKSKRAEAGFSLLEVLIVIAVMAVVAAMAIPTWQRMQKNARLNGDAHNLAGELSVAKLRAAANFTESRLFFFTGTDNTQYFRVDVWNKTLSSNGCWVPDGKANPQSGDCITASTLTGNENFLSTGVSAGYGSLSTSPVASLAIGQATNCMQGGTGPTTGGSQISNTSCIQFNSRGVPTLTAASGMYITDGTRVYAITTNPMGMIHSYVIPASGGSWKAY